MPSPPQFRNTYLFDNNTSARLVQFLRELGAPVSHVRDEADLGEHAKDVPIIKFCGENKRVLVTADDNMKTRPPEIAAIRTHKVTAIFLPASYLDWGAWRQAEWFLRHLPLIDVDVSKANPGTIFKARSRGGISRW